MVALSDDLDPDGAWRRHAAAVADSESPPTPVVRSVGVDVIDDEDDVEVPPEVAKRRAAAQLRRQVVEWVLLIGLAVVIALVVKAFLVQAFYIPTGSMEPTLAVNDRVLVNKLAYRLGDPERGDIIVFDAPPSARTDDVQELIKRVIGLPGETIQSTDGRIYIDGQLLEEPYLTDEHRENLGEPIPPTFIPEGHYFVMGDNRPNSQDSRFFGVISEDAIVGRAFIRIWPIPDFGFL
jgi:signal peptidase I